MTTPLSFIQLHPLPRWHCSGMKNVWPDMVDFHNLSRFQNNWAVAAAIFRKNDTKILAQAEASDKETVIRKTNRTVKGTATRVRKKTSKEVNTLLEVTDNASSDETVASASTETTKRTATPRRRVVPTSAVVDEEKTDKTVKKKRKTRRNHQVVDNQGSESSHNDQEAYPLLKTLEDDSDEDVEVEKDDGEDISYTYGWPPLVCCFGASQYAFVPSGRPANRLIDFEIHERMKNASWSPEKFVRAPGGCAGMVAIALASLGGKVAFMGKLGDDDYGETMLYYMNVNNVQTRSVRIDTRRETAISHMRLAKRGRLRATCIKTCAEDSMLKSEINIDVLKEAKIFYFSTQSLLDQKMRSTTQQATIISKKLGGVIFYDVNLPLPLWQSREESKTIIQEFWNLANIIEVTKQELEFLCGIIPTEEFDTNNNCKSKFLHYDREIVAPLWHENLKLLIVTNGTSKIHYYTEEHNGYVHGMEDAPITPFTSDMSASGNGIVAGLLRMLAVEPDRVTDKGYLERTIKYAIDCGVIDQWLLARQLGYPPRDEMEYEEVEADPNGIKAITEKEFRTLKPVS